MKKSYTLLCFIFFIFTVNCSSDPFEVEENALETKNVTGDSGGNTGPQGPESAFDDYQDGQVVLGRDLSNIYSVEAMREAYTQKYPNGDSQYGPSGIRTTHYYVRFLPKNEDEYDSIVKYDLSEVPLYSEIVKGGTSYHDPSIPADRYTWQYALIPVNKLEPTSIQYEILKNMFIVDYGSAGVPGPGGTPSYTFWENLEIINHKAETGEDIGSGISWTPSGKIEVYDELLQRYIPIVGVRVSISANGYRPNTVMTDVNGNFRSIYPYSTSVYYKVIWGGGSTTFEIKDGEKDQAYLISNRSFLPFNVKLNDKNIKQRNFATIYRAGRRAYRLDYLGLNRPVVKNFGRLPLRPLRIAYVHETEGFSLGLYHLNAGSLIDTKPNISIHEAEISSDRIFGITTHELAHAAQHINYPNYNWSNSNKIIHESWASAVEYYITKLEYEEYGKNIDTYQDFTVDWEKPVTYFIPASMSFVVPNSLNLQVWPHAGNSSAITNVEYSSLIIDLIDSDNQAIYFKLNPALMPGVSYKTFPNDDVSGFELSEIQTALSVSNLEGFKNKIKILNSRYNYNEPSQIDTLFRRFEYYWNRRN